MSITRAFKSTAEDTRDEMVAKADEAIAKSSRLVEKAEHTVGEATDLALKEINELVAALNTKLAALGTSPADVAEKAKSTYSDIEKLVAREVSERPVRTLAIAGLAGLVLGMITRK